MAKSTTFTRRWWKYLAGALLLALWLPGSPGVARAHANFDHSTPAPNSKLPGTPAPSQVQIWFTEGVETRFCEIKVLDSSGNRVDTGGVRGLPGEREAIATGLKPGLPEGAYTVLYKNVSAEDGHIITGGFAFLIGAGNLPEGVAGVSPLQLADRKGRDGGSNANLWSVGWRWLNYLAGAAVVGALAYTLLVWRRAVGRAKASGKLGPQLATAYGRGLERAGRIVWAGLTGLLAGWLGWAAYQAAAFSGQSLGQLAGLGVEAGGSGPGAWADFLAGSRYGQIWTGRLVLLVALVVVWTAVAGRPGWPARAGGPAPDASGPVVSRFETRQRGWWLALGLGMAVLLTTSLGSHAAAVAQWSWLAIANDWLHLLSTSIWIGGLLAMALGLAGAIPALLPGSGDRTRLLAALIPAFSQVAILSVAALLITGTINAALQLGDATQLFSSAYGVGLSLKLALLLPLLLFGAYNLLVVSPRMRAFARSKKAGPKEGAGSVAAGALGLSFRRAVLAETVLAGLVLLASAFLTSSAPPKNLESGGVLYFQAAQAGLKIELAISPGAVGDNAFEARLTDSASGNPVADAASVDLRLSMLEMNMGSPRLGLAPVQAKPGYYSGTGPVLSMTGQWQATLVIQRAAGQEALNVPVTFRINR